MTETTISCPKCKSEIKLTESLAAPLVEATRRQYEQKLEENNRQFAKREEAIRTQEETLRRTRSDWEAGEQTRLKKERERIANEERQRAAVKFATEINQKGQEIQHLEEVLKARDEKLSEAQKTQADFLKRERALADQKRELELTIERRVQDSLVTIRTRARLEAEQQLSLKVQERDQTITAMQKQIEDLRRRSEQGSQQLQGEILELQLESLLAAKFPFDSIQPVRKGEHGGDILQGVVNGNGQTCGSILWETKRTRNWSDGWLPKLRDDQRNAQAEIAVIVSQVLPKTVETFEFIDGIWVTHPRTMIPVACLLRQSLIEIETARRTSEGQQTKAEMIYQYLSSAKFRQRLSAIVEAFTSMREDLDKEKRVITRQWAKRDEQIHRVMQATVGMYGDMQGIAGKTMQEIEGLELEESEVAVGASTAIKRIA